MEFLQQAVIIGTGATAATDLWALARERVLGAPRPDFGLVGRWFAHMARGRFRHERIGAAQPVRGERLLGWLAHYAIGAAFAGLLLGIWGLEWMRDPTLVPALAVGIGTVAAPFLVMQPGMGAGIAASRTPRPSSARLQSVLTHTVFGLGLYATAMASRFLAA